MGGSPLEFLVVGLNHRTAPLEVREKLSLTKAQLPEALRDMEGHGAQGVILCTCNRSEFYVMEPLDRPGAVQGQGLGEERVKGFLADRFGVSLEDIKQCLYVYRGYECAHHLFRVASSLDSMVLGEEQIIGQVREAYDIADQAGTVPGPLSHLFQQALGVGRRVRRETGIGRNALSVSRACVELARGAVGDLKDLRVMVVGAGDAGKLAAAALRRNGATDIAVANRTYGRAEELAQKLGARAMAFRDIPQELNRTDIVIGCTASPGYVLEADLIRRVMAARPERPLLLLDIAVPRDIDPAAGWIDNVYLYDVDDLESVYQANRIESNREARRAEEMVAQEAGGFLEWWSTPGTLPTVLALRRRAEEMRERELAKTLKRLNGNLTPEQVESLDAMTRAIVNKLLHGPTVYLKGRRRQADLQVAKDIFRLADAPTRPISRWCRTGASPD